MSKQEQPGHYTQHGTKKHQCNGPVSWTAIFKRVAGADGQVGDGVRAALAYATSHSEAFVGWAKSHPDAWARASTAPATKPARASKPARAGKAPERAAKRAAGKAAVKAGVKAPKAPKAPSKLLTPKAVKAAVKAAEQQTLPEVK